MLHVGIMAPYMGLTGRKLHTAIWIEAWIAVATFGYCSAGAGGVLNMPAFREQFPSIDVTGRSSVYRQDAVAVLIKFDVRCSRKSETRQVNHTRCIFDDDI